MDLLDIVGDKKKIKILNEISKQKDFISLREISRKTKISPSTVYRIFSEFVKLGIIKKVRINSINVYKPTKKLLEIKMRKEPFDEFIESIKPFVEEIYLVGKSEKGANLIIITDNPNEIKRIETIFNKNNDFRVQSITLDKDSYKRLTELKVIQSGERIFKKN